MDGAHVGALLEQMDREGMPQGMRRGGFGDAAALMRLLTHSLHGAPGDVLARDIAGEKPHLGLGHAPPVAQDVQQLGREHDVAVFLPLAEFNADDHALAVDGGGFEADGFGDAQPGRVASRQDGAVLEAGHGGEKL